MQSLRGDDAPFSFRFSAPEAAIEALGLTPGRTKADRAVQAAVVAAAAVEHDGAGRWISYSRSHDWWAAGRYDGTPVSMKRMIRTVEELASKGLVESFVQTPGAHMLTNEAERVQSAFRAWPALTNRLAGIRMDAIERPAVVMKDENGDPIPFPKTERAARIVREIEDVNEWFKTFDVKVDPAADPANWKRTAYHLHARKVRNGKTTWACTLPTPVPEVVRIFGRGRLDRHGRLYGWWQVLPKERRGELLINGEILIEEDFSALHPTLLYAMKGIRLTFDPYDVWAFPRAEAKLALNIGINCKRGLSGTVRTLLDREDWGHGYRYTKRLVDEVAARNKPIKEFLGSDAGVMLMSIDSRLCLDVLKASRKANIPALPVHDSFQAPAGKASQVRAIMGEVLDRVRVTIYPKSSMGSISVFLHNTPAQRGAPWAELLGNVSPEPRPVPAVEVSVPCVFAPPVPRVCTRDLSPAAPSPEPRTQPAALSLEPRVCTRNLAPHVPDLSCALQDVVSEPHSPTHTLEPHTRSQDPEHHTSSREARAASSVISAVSEPRTLAYAFPDLPCRTLRIDMTDSRPSVVVLNPNAWCLWDIDGTEVRGSPVMLRPMAADLIALGHDPYTRPTSPPPNVTGELPSDVVPRVG